MSTSWERASAGAQVNSHEARLPVNRPWTMITGEPVPSLRVLSNLTFPSISSTLSSPRDAFDTPPRPVLASHRAQAKHPAMKSTSCPTVNAMISSSSIPAIQPTKSTASP